MGITEVLVGVFFTVSLLINFGLIYYILKVSKKKGPPTYDAQALLQDLLSGPALLKIEYIDKTDLLLRSPRHSR